MIYSNGKVVNIYKGDTPIKKVMNVTDVVWQKKAITNLVDFTFLDSVGAKNYYKLNVKQGSTYTVHLDKPAYMDAGYYPNDISIISGDNLSDVHTIIGGYRSDVVLTVWGNAKVTQITNGGQ